MADFVLLDFETLARSTGGLLVAPAARGPLPGFTSVAIDSRQVKKGGLFICLLGTAQDGHDYLESAFKNGASSALVALSRMEARGEELKAIASRYGAVLVAVENTLTGLQAAAAAYLDRFPSLIRVGITGSSGKTTTKELAAAMVREEKRVVINEGNLNSETGLPLSAFSVRDEHEVGIFEMGMNRRGEMGELARVLRPHIALIVNVGSAHIGILGSREAIAEEKKAVFSQFTGKELALIPEGDDFSAFLADGVKGRVELYGRTTLTEFSGETSRGLDGCEFQWAGETVVLPLPGAHNVSNALAAAAIARALGISNASIVKALSKIQPLFGRGEIFRGDITVVRDCYNANPEAVEASIAFCDSVDWKGRRLYVIGSMLELGERSESEHRRIGEILASSRADSIFLFGKETEAAMASILASRPDLVGKVVQTADMEVLSRELSRCAQPGDLVLLKGSRGTALERLGSVFGMDGKGPH